MLGLDGTVIKLEQLPGSDYFERRDIHNDNEFPGHLMTEYEFNGSWATVSLHQNDDQAFLFWDTGSSQIVGDINTMIGVLERLRDKVSEFESGFWEENKE